MSALSLDVVPEFPVYDRKTGKSVDVVATVLARATDDTTRPPISVTAVLDVSGSMSGKKLSLVVETCKFMVRQLSAEDRLSIVIYDSEVRELCPLRLMTAGEKNRVVTKLDGVAAGSATNLSGGLLKGLSHQLGLEVEEKEPVRSLLLFTDGLANVGITDKHKLVDCVKSALGHVHKVQIHTLGFGADHDEELLQLLAEVGGGNYYFVESTDQIPQAFADVLGGISSVTAQNVELDITHASSDIKIQEIFAGFKVEDNKDGSKRVIFGDLYSEERKDVLMRIQVPKCVSDTDEQPLIHASLSYVDVVNAEMAKTNFTLTVARKDSIPSDLVSSEVVVDQRCRFEGIAAMKEATKEADKGNLPQAKKILQDAKQHLEKYSDTSREARLVLAEMAQIEQHLTTKTDYSCAGSKYLRAVTSSHMRQRSSPAYCTSYQMQTISNYSTAVGTNVGNDQQPIVNRAPAANPQSRENAWQRFVNRLSRSSRELLPARSSNRSRDRFSFDGTKGSYRGRDQA